MDKAICSGAAHRGSRRAPGEPPRPRIRAARDGNARPGGFVLDTIGGRQLFLLFWPSLSSRRAARRVVPGDPVEGARAKDKLAAEDRADGPYSLFSPRQR